MGWPMEIESLSALKKFSSSKQSDQLHPEINHSQIKLQYRFLAGNLLPVGGDGRSAGVNMRCIAIMDGRFVSRGGQPASHHMDYDSFGRHFLDTFDEVTIVGRLFPVEEAGARPICGPNVNFIPLPAYSGPERFLFALPRIVRIFCKLLQQRDVVFLLRVPGGVSTIFFDHGLRHGASVRGGMYRGYSRSVIGGRCEASIAERLSLVVDSSGALAVQAGNRNYLRDAECPSIAISA